MKRDLIIDVGFHTGRDSAYYLAKGFRVVAVEANPVLVAKARVEFSEDLAAGRLVLHEVAIADRTGFATFYVSDTHDDWGTASQAFAERNVKMGSTASTITVPTVTFDDILRDAGIPYYLKVDIEGSDDLCVEALRAFDDRPRYISVEAALTSMEEARSQLDLLAELGYDQFKIVNQALNRGIRLIEPALEGIYVDARFDDTTSGPFGEEAPGEWMDLETTTRRYRGVIRAVRWFGGTTPLYGTVWHRLFERISGEPVGWYDFHARRGPQ